MATLRLQLSGKVFVVCGLWLVVLGLYFLLLRPALLPEDPRFMGSSIETLRAAAPGLERWLGNVFNVMGGFMVATGAMTLLVACRYLASRKRGTFPVMAVAGAASVALMSATNLACRLLRLDSVHRMIVSAVSSTRQLFKPALFSKRLSHQPR